MIAHAMIWKSVSWGLLLFGRFHILHYYIESGIPVALGLKLGEENKHSVIDIGHIVPKREKLGEQLTCAYDAQSKNVIWTCDIADTVDTYCKVGYCLL